jgi:hypothetical protein
MSTYACTSTLNKTFLLFEHNCLSAYACSAMKKNVTRTRVGSEGRVCVFHLSLSANPTTLAVWCPRRCTFLSHWLLPLSLTSSFGNVQFFFPNVQQLLCQEHVSITSLCDIIQYSMFFPPFFLYTIMWFLVKQ